MSGAMGGGEVTGVVSLLAERAQWRLDQPPRWSWVMGKRIQMENQRAAWLIPCAHGTPTIKLWSFDVRSEGPSQVTLWGQERASLEGLFSAEGERPDRPSCSQNAHDETVLVRCAQ